MSYQVGVARYFGWKISVLGGVLAAKFVFFYILQLNGFEMSRKVIILTTQTLG